MLEDVIAWDKDGVGHPKKCMDNEEAIESLQQQIKVQQKQIEVLYKILGVKYE